MTYLVKLGVVVACVVAACSSSKDALFNDGGPEPDAQFEPDGRFDATTSDPCDGAGQVVRDGVLMCNFGELDGGGAAGSGGGAAGSGGAAGIGDAGHQAGGRIAYVTLNRIDRGRNLRRPLEATLLAGAPCGPPSLLRGAFGRKPA